MLKAARLLATVRYFDVEVSRFRVFAGNDSGSGASVLCYPFECDDGGTTEDAYAWRVYVLLLCRRTLERHVIRLQLLREARLFTWSTVGTLVLVGVEVTRAFFVLCRLGTILKTDIVTYPAAAALAFIFCVCRFGSLGTLCGWSVSSFLGTFGFSSAPSGFLLGLAASSVILSFIVLLSSGPMV